MKKISQAVDELKNMFVEFEKGIKTIYQPQTVFADKNQLLNDWIRFEADKIAQSVQNDINSIKQLLNSKW